MQISQLPAAHLLVAEAQHCSKQSETPVQSSLCRLKRARNATTAANKTYRRRNCRVRTGILTEICFLTSGQILQPASRMRLTQPFATHCAASLRFRKRAPAGEHLPARISQRILVGRLSRCDPFQRQYLPASLAGVRDSAFRSIRLPNWDADCRAPSPSSICAEPLGLCLRQGAFDTACGRLIAAS